MHISTKSLRISLACASFERMKHEPTVQRRYLCHQQHDLMSTEVDDRSHLYFHLSKLARAKMARWGPYSRGSTFPACWTSSYRSAYDLPFECSSLKNACTRLGSVRYEQGLTGTCFRRTGDNGPRASPQDDGVRQKLACTTQNTFEVSAGMCAAPQAWQPRIAVPP